MPELVLKYFEVADLQIPKIKPELNKTHLQNSRVQKVTH